MTAHLTYSFITAHLTFSFITAHFVHHCTLEQALVQHCNLFEAVSLEKWRLFKRSV